MNDNLLIFYRNELFIYDRKLNYIKERVIFNIIFNNTIGMNDVKNIRYSCDIILLYFPQQGHSIMMHSLYLINIVNHR